MSERKGLNVPQLSRETALDKIFRELSEFITIDDKEPKDAIAQLYAKLDGDSNNRVDQINAVLAKSFEFVSKIQDYSLRKEAQNKASGDPEKVNLITISLHDMKYFNELMNLIIVQGIYPCLPTGVGIPLEQRRLKSFNIRSKLFRFEKVPNGLETLQKIVKYFEVVFDKGGDVKDLLLKGSGLTDILTALTVLVSVDPSFKSAFQKFENKSDTYNLFNIYTILLQTTRIPRYQAFLSERLTSITVHRENGVMSLIDFVVGIRDDEDVNIDKFNNVNRILIAKPKDMTSVEYFTKLFNQIYEILVFINRPVMSSVVVNFIRVLYSKNKRIIHDFLFKKIWNILSPDTSNFKQGETVVEAKELNDAINVLISLTKETSPEFLNELFSKIILNLWAYMFYLKKKKLEYYSIISNIMVSFFTITSNNDFLENTLLNLIKSGGDDWKFETNLENKLSSIVKSSILDKNLSSEEIFDDLDIGLEIIVELFKNLNNDIVRTQFLTVLNRWISKQNNDNLLDQENPFIILIDLKFLEKINDQFRDALLNKPEDVLLVVRNLLTTRSTQNSLKKEETNEEVDSDDEDEDDEDIANPGNLNILLELLSAIISETNPIELTRHKHTLKEISQILIKFSSDKHCQALHKRIEDFLSDEKHTVNNGDDEKTKDKELLEKAITSMNDPLIPIRAHGLYLLRQLIVKRSPVISLDFVIELHIVQLHDSEPFIYMNVIKSLSELIEFDKDATVDFLCDFYTKKEEKLDDKLKIGEVILNFISKTGELFTGPLADKLVAKTLGVIQNFEEDNRLRMSAMSLIGQALRTNAIGLEKFIKDALDCSIGILELEKEVIMKRSAVVLISDLISFGGLDIVPRGYGEKLKTVLSYVKVNADDYLLVEQIDKVLEIIDELIRDRLKPSVNTQFDALKIKEISRS